MRKQYGFSVIEILLVVVLIVLVGVVVWRFWDLSQNENTINNEIGGQELTNKTEQEPQDEILQEVSLVFDYGATPSRKLVEAKYNDTFEAKAIDYEDNNATLRHEITITNPSSNITLSINDSDAASIGCNPDIEGQTNYLVSDVIETATENVKLIGLRDLSSSDSGGIYYSSVHLSEYIDSNLKIGDTFTSGKEGDCESFTATKLEIKGVNLIIRNDETESNYYTGRITLDDIQENPEFRRILESLSITDN